VGQSSQGVKIATSVAQQTEGPSRTTEAGAAVEQKKAGRSSAAKRQAAGTDESALDPPCNGQSYLTVVKTASVRRRMVR
jgi:hypothetical protein